MKNGSIVWHCKRTSGDGAEIEIFEEPVSYRLRIGYLTIQPKSGNMYTSVFGEFKDYSEQVCGTPYELWENVINEGDRFYLNKTPDTDEDNIEAYGYGYDANYKVVKVSNQNRVIYFALKSIVE